MGANSKSKNKKPKTQVIFDEQDREWVVFVSCEALQDPRHYLCFKIRKYLLGFRKRKQERKTKAKSELEEKIKLEKKRQRDLVHIFCKFGHIRCLL